MKKYVDKTWQPRGGRNKKTIHLSGNADVVPQSGPKMKGRATIRCLPDFNLNCLSHPVGYSYLARFKFDTYLERVGSSSLTLGQALCASGVELVAKVMQPGATSLRY